VYHINSNMMNGTADTDKNQNRDEKKIIRQKQMTA
jgi:hypothetical protein